MSGLTLAFLCLLGGVFDLAPPADDGSGAVPALSAKKLLCADG